MATNISVNTDTGEIRVTGDMEGGSGGEDVEMLPPERIEHDHLVADETGVDPDEVAEAIKAAGIGHDQRAAVARQLTQLLIIGTPVIAVGTHEGKVVLDLPSGSQSIV